MPTTPFTVTAHQPFQWNPLFKTRWRYHTVFWLLYIVFITFIFYCLYGIKEANFYLLIPLFFPCEIAMVYLNLYVLMPRLLFARKYIQYGVSIIGLFIIVSIINVYIHRLNVWLGCPYYSINTRFTVANMVSRCFELFSLTCITSGIKLAKDWLLNLQWIQDKEKQYLEAELNFLKGQIQPHFFFNTLNNLYSLTLKKSDQAPEIVLKLSDLMSYMLYESNVPKTPVSKEITYLQNYIDVEQLRFGDRLQLTFDIEGDIEQAYIPPMLLILFVENSFKHGARHIVHHISISIQLQITNDQLYFRVSNPLPDTPVAGNHTGIGLKNVQRRLELLYGKDYSLTTEAYNNNYIVSLKIPVWK